MILAVDLGTSSLKAALLSLDGQLHFRTRVPYRFQMGQTQADFDALQWEDAFSAALTQMPGADISVVAMSGNGPTLVPCNSRGEPLASANLWLHERASPLPGTPSYYLPRAAWLRDNLEGVWEQTKMLLPCPEWLQYRLTGRASVALPHEAFRPFVWDKSQLTAYGLEPSLFPDTAAMGEEAGRVSPAAASRFSLKEGVPVAAVGSDFMAALLGSGAVKPGMVCDRAGSSEGINFCTTRPVPGTALRSLPHVVPGLWNVAAILPSSGAVFEWYRRRTGQGEVPYGKTLAEIEAVPAGRPALLFFPSPGGGGRFQGLKADHGPAEMGRAVLEAIGFGVRRGVETLEAAGLPVSSMRVCGGQTRGMVWNQMKADICGRELHIPRIEDAELAGCAACALTALGMADSIQQAAGRFVEIRHVVKPRRENARKYSRLYREYRDIDPGLD